MKKPWSWAAAVVVLLGGLFVGSAQAENRAGTWNLSPLIGGYLFEGNQNLKDRPVFGLGLGYNLTENWGVEGTFTYTSSRAEHGTDRDQVKVSTGRIDALYHFLPGEMIVPYAALGGGIISLDQHSNLSKKRGDQDLVADYGAGVKIFFNPDWALRFDLRHILDFNVRDEHKSHEFYNNLSVLAGLTWQFGGK